MQVCECLNTAISLRGLCEDRVNCEVYLNDLRGISNEMVESLVSDDHPTAQAVLDSVLAESGPEFVQKMKSAMSDKIVEKTVIEAVDTARWITPHTTIPTVANTLRGAFIQADESPYLYINIGYVEIYSSGGGSTSEPLAIYDLDTGDILDSFTFDNSTTGFKRVLINKKYIGFRYVAVLYDASQVETIEAQQYGVGYYRNLCKPCNCNYIYVDCVEFDQLNPIWYSERQSASNCGIRISFSVGCSLEPYICTNVPTFVHGYKYLVAMKLVDEIFASFRLNQVTLWNEKELELIFERLQASYEEFFNNIKTSALPECEICFSCSPKVTQAFYNIP